MYVICYVGTHVAVCACEQLHVTAVCSYVVFTSMYVVVIRCEHLSYCVGVQVWFIHTCQHVSVVCACVCKDVDAVCVVGL